MNKLLKIGIPILIVALMLIIGTGVVLAKQVGTSVLDSPTVSYDGYRSGRWEACRNSGYCWGPGASYEPGAENYSPCHGYWR